MCCLKPHQERNSLKMQQKLIRLSFRPLPFFYTHWVCISSVKFTYFILFRRNVERLELKADFTWCTEIAFVILCIFLATPSAYGWQHSRLNLIGRSFGSYLWHLLIVFDLLKFLSDRRFFSHYNSAASQLLIIGFVRSVGTILAVGKYPTFGVYCSHFKS